MSQIHDSLHCIAYIALHKMINFSTFPSPVRSAFPGGLVFKAGGVDSGMRHVDKTHVVKLYRVAGGKRPVFMEVSLDQSYVKVDEEINESLIHKRFLLII